ncbi:MAG: 6-pyruvoyl trahydropterin synthase family protein [Thermodesulfobacteriota bacterium]
MSFKKLITKRVEFSASHRYWNPNLSEKENFEIFGKSSYESGHGHNFSLEVTVEGEVDENTGMIINLFDLKRFINDVLLEFDHKNLNSDTPYFKNIIPTPENICRVLWDLLKKRISVNNNCTLYKIRLHETEDLYVDYWRD